MKRKNSELRGLIYDKYNSEAEMARALGWSRQRLNKITNGLKEPDISELNSIAKRLEKSVGEIAQIFLQH